MDFKADFFLKISLYMYHQIYPLALHSLNISHLALAKVLPNTYYEIFSKENPLRNFFYDICLS